MASTGRRLLPNQDQSDTTADQPAQASFKNTRSAKTLGQLSQTDLVDHDCIHSVKRWSFFDIGGSTQSRNSRLSKWTDISLHPGIKSVIPQLSEQMLGLYHSFRGCMERGRSGIKGYASTKGLNIDLVNRNGSNDTLIRSKKGGFYGKKKKP